MRVRLNLATKPLESHRRFLAGASLSAFAAAVVFLALGWHVYSVRKAATDVRARREKMSQEFAAYEAQRGELQRYFAAATRQPFLYLLQVFRSSSTRNSRQRPALRSRLVYLRLSCCSDLLHLHYLLVQA